MKTFVCFIALSAVCGLSQGASFTAGNLVVVRVGAGSGALSSAATAAFLDEYTPAGTLVQSIALPTADAGGSRTLTLSGTATSEGALSLSSDGQYLLMGGFAAAVGTAGVASTSSSAANRVVARISADGTINTLTYVTDSRVGGGDIRSAASDNGTDLWATSSQTAAGTYFVPSFSAANATISPLVAINSRVVAVFGGQLYYSTGSGTTGVYQVGTGLPTSGTQPTTLIAGSASPYAFFFADLGTSEAGLDTLYLADDSAGQIKKFTKVSGVWSQTGSATFSGARGLTGVVSGSTVTLYATTGASGSTGGGTLVKLVDSTGYNGTLSSIVTTLATAATNEAFRGVAFAPQAGTPTNPSASGTATSAAAGTSTSFAGTITAGTNPTSTGLAVSCDLTAVGGSANFAMTVAATNFSGSYAIPAGTAAQTYTLPCAVSDAQMRSSSFNISLTVTLISISPSTIPGGTEGVSYSQTLTAVNGTSCSFGNTGAVPPGLTLGSSGLLSGIPTLAGTFNFTVNAICSNGSAAQAYSVAIIFACENGMKTSTGIHTIQGSGPSSAMVGQAVEVEGIVVGSFQGASKLNGFYLQEPDSTWDNDPSTSEGIFIFDNGFGGTVNMGDRVRVAGTVSEFSSSGSFLGVTAAALLTEIGNLTNKLVCGTGNSFTRTTVTLPTANAGDLERYEGMAVQFSQLLTVTGNFNLGTFDQVELAPSVLYAPTDVPDTTANKDIWSAATTLNSRNAIQMDDGSNVSDANLFPTIFPQGGLSDANTLRTGALVNYDAGTLSNAPLVGVLDNRFNAYRILPTSAVTFYAANPRPPIAPILTGVGGRFRAVSANVLNFFTTLGSRGAATTTEFNHQKTKVIEALFGMNADLYGLSEVQNFANGNTNGGTYTNTALQSLVDGLNCKNAGYDALCTGAPATPSGPFALIDTLGLGGANGTDAIRTAVIYRPDRLTTVGGPMMYYQNDENRPTLAQTFQPAAGVKASSQTFTFVVNHYRSKGSACGGASDDVYQGTCNGMRLSMAQNVVAWLAGNPTGDPSGANRRFLVVGDFNAYYGEDPIQFFKNNGYANLINLIVGPSAYSYNFGSQRGYLDHAMANAAMNGLVKSVAEWHNNSDEPSSLQALDSADKSAAAQAAYYGANPYAASDHDPIVIGFNPLAGDFNDDGVVDANDQKLITGSIGKSASAADRRMDLDGDGTITANDYRLWTALYRAFIQ